MYIIPVSILVVLLPGICQAYKFPRPISALLSSAEVTEIQRDAYLVKSQDYIAQKRRFKALLAPVRVSFKHSRESPKCLGTNPTREFLAYDSTCTYSITPSEYCCQVYAEQACPDPAVEFSVARKVVNDRLDGLGGIADKFRYDSCMLNKCSASCSVSEGSDVACKHCSNVCQRFCLSNMLHVCLKRTCGQKIISVAERAMAHNPRGRNALLHHHTEQDAAEKLHMSESDIREVERSEIVRFALSVLDDAPVPLCTDTELRNADTAANVIVDNAGSTFADALIGCNSQYLEASKLDSVIADPTILARSQECTAVSVCERNHIKLAMDRAQTQVDVLNSKRRNVAESR